jgi:nucleoside-diphosphate-sugar epimerase
MQTIASAFALRASEGKPAAGGAWRGRARLGMPRLLIVGCGKVGLRIVARLNRRFRIIATTTSPQQCELLRKAGAIPILIDLDGRPADRLEGLAPRVIHLVPPPPEGQPAPITERARRRVDGERRARAHPWHASVLRVPGIYGPGRLPIERLQRATPAPLPAEDVLINHIHIDDLARICIASLFRAAPRRIYNAVDDSCLRLGEYLDLVADQFDLPRAPRLPREALRQAVSPMQFSFFDESRRIGNRRIKNELRVRLQFPTAHDGVIAAARAAPESG